MQFKPRFRPGYLKLCFSLELPPSVFSHVNKLLPDITDFFASCFVYTWEGYVAVSIVLKDLRLNLIFFFSFYQFSLYLHLNPI